MLTTSVAFDRTLLFIVYCLLFIAACMRRIQHFVAVCLWM